MWSIKFITTTVTINCNSIALLLPLWVAGGCEKCVKHEGGWVGKLVLSSVCSGATVHGQSANNSTASAHRMERGQEAWKLARARICRRKKLPLKPGMPLQNFSARQTEKTHWIRRGAGAEPGSPICSVTANTTTREWWVTAAGTLLWEVLRCASDTLLRAVLLTGGSQPGCHQVTPKPRRAHYYPLL